MNDVFVKRYPDNRGEFALLQDMYVEAGSREDWDALHDFHYKAETLPAGSKIWRCVTPSGDLVGVTVLSSPSLLLGPRHMAFPKLKPGANETHFTNVHRANWLNANLRRASRIVTDTLYRGTGASYRMLNLVNRMSGIKFIEIQSSMSKYNPFDLKAGFTHVGLKPAAAYRLGLKFFRRLLASHPADFQSVMNEINAMPKSLRENVIQQIRVFYFRHSAKEKTGSNLKVGMSRVNNMPVERLIKELQQLVFASPVYGIWANPDFGKTLPPRLPLSAFDHQKPNEPLRFSCD